VADHPKPKDQQAPPQQTAAAQKLSPVEIEQNKNRQLLKKIDVLEGTISTKGIAPTTLEKRVVSLDAELKGMIRQTEHMAKVVSSLYRERKKPIDLKEYEYKLQKANKAYSAERNEKLALAKQIKEKEEEAEELKAGFEEEKKKHSEDSDKLLDEISSLKKEFEKTLHEKDEESKNSTTQHEDKIKEIKSKAEEQHESLKDKNHEISQLNEKIMALEKVEKENEQNKEKLAHAEENNKKLAELIKDYKGKLSQAELDLQRGAGGGTIGKAGSASAGENEPTSAEFQEMNNTIKTLLKERKQPQGDQESQYIIRKLKKEIKESKENIVTENPQQTQQLEKKEEEINILLTRISAYEQDAEGLKNLIHKLQTEKAEASDTIKKLKTGGGGCGGGDITSKEFEQMSSLVASFVKDRKEPFDSNETKVLINKYKAEISRLKASGAGVSESLVEDLKKQVVELQASLEEARSMIPESGKDNSADFEDLANTLKTQVDDLKMKLNLANNKLSLYGEETY
jgi:chromosome segregation ATPase